MPQSAISAAFFIDLRRTGMPPPTAQDQSHWTSVAPPERFLSRGCEMNGLENELMPAQGPGRGAERSSNPPSGGWSRRNDPERRA